MKVTDAVVSNNDHGYDLLLKQVRDNFEEAVNEGKKPLFTTDATDLFAAFLAALPSEHQQHYTCHACRRFFERYGGLVTIEESGITVPAVWPTLINVPQFFDKAIAGLKTNVAKAKVTGVFVASDNVLGEPVTGEWHHFAVKNYRPFPKGALTAFQRSAEKAEEFKMLMGALAEYDKHTAEQALRVVESDTLYRSEKVLGPATFFSALHESVAKYPKHRANIVWLALADAPAGFAHVKSSMIGTLLDDIKAGLPFETIAARFKEKMSPIQYQRPTAQPSLGTIAQAEKLVEQMGVASSLRRRYARLDEVLPFAIWKPVTLETAPVGGGVFDHLKEPIEAPKLDLPATTITWAKFVRDVLPGVSSMDMRVPSTYADFFAIATQADPDALPILQWDHLEERNPFSHYHYLNGSTPGLWGLVGSSWVRINAVVRKPSFFRVNMKNDVDGVYFILDGAKDSRDPGTALFPENMKSEYHGIRSVIEAHSNKTKMEGKEEAGACGLALLKDSHGVIVRTVSKLGNQQFNIDRLE